MTGPLSIQPVRQNSSVRFAAREERSQRFQALVFLLQPAVPLALVFSDLMAAEFFHWRELA